jgi:hypothetical protein
MFLSAAIDQKADSIIGNRHEQLAIAAPHLDLDLAGLGVPDDVTAGCGQSAVASNLAALFFCMGISTLGKKWCVNVKHAGAMLMGVSNRMFWKKRYLYKILIAIDTILW